MSRTTGREQEEDVREGGSSIPISPALSVGRTRYVGWEDSRFPQRSLSSLKRSISTAPAQVRPEPKLPTEYGCSFGELSTVVACTLLIGSPLDVIFVAIGRDARAFRRVVIGMDPVPSLFTWTIVRVVLSGQGSAVCLVVICGFCVRRYANT